MQEIGFELPQREIVSLKIYDITDRLIKTLFEGEGNAGKYNVIWDGKNEL